MEDWVDSYEEEERPEEEEEYEDENASEELLDEDVDGEEEAEESQNEPIESLNDLFARGLQDLELLGLTDIGNLAAWSVSTYKTGYGVEQLRDDNSETFWQSDSSLPHHLDAHFSKRVSIERICIFVDFLQDESYTPSKIAIYSGYGHHDLQQVSTLELNQPRGWVQIPMNDVSSSNALKTFLVRISILANHQSGKDVHMRAVRLYSAIDK